MNPSHQPILQEQDLLHTILADQKRVCHEYATAVMESNCHVVRQAFTDLLQLSLEMQAQLHDMIREHDAHRVSSRALRQDIDKQLQHYAHTNRHTQHLVQQQAFHQPAQHFQL